MARERRIVYFEDKSDVAALQARILEAYTSKSGKSYFIYGREYASLKGSGHKANYFDIDTGAHVWISNPRKDGNDGLYQTKVYINENVRKEYWVDIRELPSRSEQESFISAGKHRAGGKEVKVKNKNY